MFFWFAGMAVLVVWQVFRDPNIDYRLVVAGALAPDAIDAVTGGAWVFHTLALSVLVLVAVMLVTRSRKAARRRLLAIPIGMLCHLLLDGVWTDGDLFWWPALGEGFGDRRLPSLDRPTALVVLMEVAGVAALVRHRRLFVPARPC